MIKTLSKCVREYKKPAIMTPIFMTLEVVMEVIIPVLMARLIDFGIDASDMAMVYRYGLALVISALFSLCFGIAGGRFAAVASAGFAKNVRKDMFYNIQKFSFSNIDKFSSASIVTRLTTDVTNVQNAFQMLTRMAFRAPMMLFFSIIMAFRVNSQLSLVFVGIVPLLAVGLFTIIRIAHPVFERVFKTYDELNNVVQEDLHGIRVVKSFVREDYEIKKFKKISKKIYDGFCKAERTLAFNMPLMQFCVYGCMLLISWIGARLIVAGSMTTGELMSMIMYTMQVLMSLMMLSFVFVMIVISRASAERITEVLKEKSSLCNKENPVTEVKNGEIIFDHVSYSYANDKNKLALKDINVSIASGMTVGIIGGTGSSKSTLVQLIARLYDVTEGSLKVGGVDVRDYDIETLRNNVAMVLQKNELFSGTIKENLRWGKEDAADEEIKKVCRLSQADEFIQTFPDKYDTYIEQGGQNVSGGQKQRLCIARALLKHPAILILDDSTSAVDTKTDALIRKAFKEEIPDTTKLIIAQRINSVMDADLILVMESGTILSMGTHEELLANCDVYREIYDSQQKGGKIHE